MHRFADDVGHHFVLEPIVAFLWKAFVPHLHAAAHLAATHESEPLSQSEVTVTWRKAGAKQRCKRRCTADKANQRHP